MGTDSLINLVFIKYIKFLFICFMNVKQFLKVLILGTQVLITEINSDQ